ncbi:heavy metal-binding protein HIP-like [Mercenaria mercenaria]|uniref:heavy metal-binding protein HIP-like n=1 Tax=Mercenaria mercenaria TaxID=6596 RepID=UPI001E1D663A|nr:heavy metal-binding protein HIP-like [Mercenaria mercenaria]
MNVNVESVFLYIATITLLVPVSESVPVGDSNQLSAVIKNITDLQIQLNEERDRRTKLEGEINIYRQVQSEMMKSVEIIDGQMGQLVNGQNVAFYARLSKSYDSIEPWATIVFSDVETNTGSAYNSTNGEFTAPITGHYVFHSNILSKQDKIIETSLRVNGNDKMFLYSGGKYHGSGSNMAVLHLNAGDNVKMVKHGSWGPKPFYIHHSWSSFSGFLLRADSSFFDPRHTPSV